MKREESVQRYNNLSRMINCFICFAGFLFTIYGNLDIDHNMPFNIVWWISPKKFFFITNSTLLLSTIAFAMSGFTYGVSARYKSKVIASHILACALSAEVLICLIFWPIFWSNPNLVFPLASLEGPQRISLFCNLCMHALPSVFLFATYALDPRINPPSYNGLLLYIAYITVLSAAFYQINGYWRYKVLKVLPKPALFALPIVLFFAGCFTVRCMYFAKLKVRRSKMFEKLTKIASFNSVLV
ncbi:hypothetical protein NEMIN01_1712 [Nematocida minor]|uniref:uncharacterized protein n=1 Tax=Nematocida minor TaxID=1912983 RepID=UPI002220FD8D|nr:uncharacterized protein NEMIN01_1712 [Nematocida minor]KAI5191857.1 hypothetical protein NEMIN01_1712 [Nematocida minor]